MTPTPQCCGSCRQKDMESPELDGSRVLLSKPMCSDLFCPCHSPTKFCECAKPQACFLRDCLHVGLPARCCHTCGLPIRPTTGDEECPDCAWIRRNITFRATNEVCALGHVVKTTGDVEKRCGKTLPDGSICRVTLDCHLHDWRQRDGEERARIEERQRIVRIAEGVKHRHHDCEINEVLSDLIKAINE